LTRKIRTVPRTLASIPHVWQPVRLVFLLLVGVFRDGFLLLHPPNLRLSNYCHLYFSTNPHSVKNTHASFFDWMTVYEIGVHLTIPYLEKVR
jgi:hypothetical protein